MNDYFPEEQGIGFRMGTDVKPVLQTIANRYVSDNPPVPVTYYLRSSQNFHITEDYMDEVKLHEKFPQMELESYAYAWAAFTPPQAGPFHFRFSAFGPVKIYVNGEAAYRTTHVQERFADQVSDICLNLQEGANSLFFECICTPLGCGFSIGSSSYKGRRIQFFGPDQRHRGMSGFIYSMPVKQRIEQVPALWEADEATGLCWYPETEWAEAERAMPPIGRIFGISEESCRDGQGRSTRDVWRFLSVTSVTCPVGGTYRLRGTGEHQGGNQTVFYADGKKTAELGSSFDESLDLAAGVHTLAFLGRDISLEVTAKDGKRIPLECPVRLAHPAGLVHSPETSVAKKLSWLYAGPFTELFPESFQEHDDTAVTEALTFQKPIDTALGKDYWRVDMPDTLIRPFNEGVLYGEWNYPLGVTLYGLAQSARTLKNPALDAYVEGHMRKCAAFYDYCMWDKATYGAAPFHNQLTTIDSLDDCGSFASAMLEVMKDHEIPGGKQITNMVAGYIKDGQMRLEDGTFYRNHSYLPIMNETMWADDMYMSIPFLCRYYERTGERAWLEEAVRQVKNFFRYLYMPELKIMSHIYDTHYGVQTKVPWGRGNGWVLFSITELLAVMPEDEPQRAEIADIFSKLCEGYLELQGKEGMWHQVLTFPDSYQETSCTAMFIYGFARGVRYGWLPEWEKYAKAALRGWDALCRTAVDWKGNIYGVCRGSGYSFSKEYYANDLGWNFNDTHGTGIVLLAGIEVEKMKSSRC